MSIAAYTVKIIIIKSENAVIPSLSGVDIIDEYPNRVNPVVAPRMQDITLTLSIEPP